MVKIDVRPGIEIDEELRKSIIKVAESVLALENSEECEVSILLTDNSEIHKLNKLYRDVDRPTDVLAFAMREGADGELNREILGDVVVSLPKAEEQAENYDHNFKIEVLYLVSHGVLHLLGYEHDYKDEMLIMQNKQDYILRLLGYDPTGLDDMYVRELEPVNGAKGR